MESKFTIGKILKNNILLTFIFLFASLYDVNAQCTGNTMQYPTAAVTVPSTCNTITTISTCNYQDEHTQLTGVLSGYSYTVENVTNGGWIVIYEGGTGLPGSAGIFISDGNSPLTFTATSSSDHWVHWVADSNCTQLGGAGGCNTTQISIASGGNLTYGCTDPLALNFDSTAICDSGCVYQYGCMDANANNYDSTAVFESGLCNYPCVSGSQSESFETNPNGLDGTLWYNDRTGPANAWVRGSNTSTVNTGPAFAYDSTYFMYVEGNLSNSNTNYKLVSKCVDLSSFTNPSLLFAYNMNGSGIGTLEVEISLDSGQTWTNLWASSGNKGPNWYEALVPLNQYTGPSKVRFNYVPGANIFSDCAIDFVRFSESPLSGCTDPFAANYDSTATYDDGSCLFPGCLDVYASNYCSSCNQNDSLSCIYPNCASLPIIETFEDTSFSVNNWLTTAGVNSSVNLSTTSPPSIAGNVSVEMVSTGSFNVTPFNEIAAFDSTQYLANFSSLNICLDLSNNQNARMSALVHMPGVSFTPTHWLRVLVNGNVIFDTDSFSCMTNSNTTLITGPVRTNMVVSDSINWDLSSYVGNSNVNITFQCVSSSGNQTYIDNINIYEVLPCTFFSSSISASPVSCNGGADGSATASQTNLIASSSQSYLWSNGDTNSLVSGLTAGSYSCIISDVTNGCSDTLSVTIIEPSAVVFSSVIVDATDSISSNGSIDVTLTGGNACATDFQIGFGTTASTGNSSLPGANLFYTWYHDNKSEITFLASELTANGLQIGSQLDEIGWEISSASGQPMNNLTIDIEENGVVTNVYSSTYTAVVGWNMMSFTNPFTWNGGDIKVITCFDNTSYTSANNFYYTTTSFVSVQRIWADNGAATLCNDPTASSSSDRPNTRFGTNSSSYIYAWSNGDSTEDITNLVAGNYSVNVTDCKNCTYSSSFTVAVNTILGCTNPTSWNYNPIANVDDSSCISVATACLDPNAFNYTPFDSLTANTNDSSLCIARVFGCTDSTFINYDPLANTDDGSCAFCAGNVVAPITENFDSLGYLGIFSQYTSDDMDWTQDNLGTPSFGTGPSDDVTGGGYYLYTEATGNSNSRAMLFSTCVDITALASPALTFSYHMLGGAMGTLNVVINNDTAWTRSGQQGPQWYRDQIDLSAYSSPVRIDFVGITGTSFSSDMAIDQVSIDELLLSGCTDTFANNYDSTAVIDDGSCIYACTASILQLSELANEGSPNDFIEIRNTSGSSCDITGWQVDDSLAMNDWTFSSGVIPAGGFWYAYKDSSYSYINDANGLLVDSLIGSFTSDLSSQGGNIYLVKGTDTVNFVVDSSLADANGVEFSQSITPFGYCYTYPTAGYANNLCEVFGCNDSTALNFNPAATQNDGSCIATVLGCTDTSATNYDSLANVDNGLCQYVLCNVYAPYHQEFSTGVLPVSQCPQNGWLTSVVSGDGWRFTGTPGYTTGSTNGRPAGSYAWVDFSGTDIGAVLQVEDVNITQLSGAAYLIFDYWSDQGTNPLTPPNNILHVEAFDSTGWDSVMTLQLQTTGWQTFTADLSNHTLGTDIVRIRFRAESGGSGNDYYNDLLLDDVKIENAPYLGCTDPQACNYDSLANVNDGSCYVLTASTSSTDVSCNGGNDGAVSVSSNITAQSILWSNGSTSAQVNGLTGGIYYVTVQDSLGCTASDSAIVNVPSGTLVTLTSVGESSPGASDGQVIANISGGNACPTDLQFGFSTTASTGNSSVPGANLFYTYYEDNKSEITFLASEISALGFTPGQELTSVGWEISTASGSPMNNLTIDVEENGVVTNVYSGTYTAVTGWNTFTFTSPLVWNGNDIKVITCFDNLAWTSANNFYYTTTSFASVQRSFADLGAGNLCSNPTTSSSFDRPNTRFGTNNSLYTYSWSNGSTTQNISGLSAGQYCLTVTDCNGCATAAVCETVTVSATLGCTDPTASNYNQFANQDDGSCTYDCSIFAISLDSISNVAPCNGNNNGYIQISTNLCSYVIWDDNQSSSLTRSSLSAGTYSVTAYTCDSVCVDSLTFVISEPSSITANGTITNSTTGSDGAISLVVSGGTPCPNIVTGYCTSVGPSSSIDSEVESLKLVGDNDSIDYVGCPGVTGLNDQTNLEVSLSSGNTYSISINFGTCGGIYSGVGQAWIDYNMDGNFSQNEAIVSAFGVNVGTQTYNFTVPSNLGAGKTRMRVIQWEAGAIPINPCGQFTYGSAIDYTISLNGGGSGYDFLWSNGDTTKDLTNLSTGTYTVTITDCNGCNISETFNVTSSIVYGCTNPNALNYDPLATIDDGSCIAILYGCTDSTAINYFPGANVDDGSCIYTTCSGSPITNLGVT
ncbi:GEVED domain-containing protein, partial [Bacteroidota bacterium]|nr:GEVED domain-containing protein [Bacteroidota bacterium]